MGVNSVPINYSISSSYSHQTNGSLGNSPTSAYGALNMNPAASLSAIHHNPVYSSNVCCLIDKGTKCTAPSGNASYSKRIERQVMKKLKLVVDPHSTHSYICDQHKQMIQTIRGAQPGANKRKRKDHDDHDDLSNDFASGSASPPVDNGRTVSGNSTNNTNNAPNNSSNNNNHHSFISGYDFDLSGFQLSALRRYKKHFRVHTKPGLNKTQLADELAKHFRMMHVNEREIISTFMYRIKHNCNKLDMISNSKE